MKNKKKEVLIRLEDLLYQVKLSEDNDKIKHNTLYSHKPQYQQIG